MGNIGIKWAVGASILAGTFYFGYKKGSGTVITNTVTTKGETEIIYKDRIVTVTKTVQPDGTVTETTKTEEKSKQEKSKTSDTKVVTIPAKKYSLGLFTSPKLVREDGRIKSVRLMPGITAGYNLGNDIFLKLGGIPADSMYMVGVEIHF